MSANERRTKVVGRPARLSLDAIITAADRILQAEGSDKLSMRRLAEELGSTPMALYYHVRDKDELLMLVMETHAQRIPRPELPADPRERLVAAALLLHELLAERPWIVEVLTGEDLIAPSAMWMVEVMIDAAVSYGHPLEQAVFVYRTLWNYIVGNLVIKVNRERRRAHSGPPVRRDQIIAQLASGTHPRLTAASGHWAEFTARDTHREAVTAIVAGLLP